VKSFLEELRSAEAPQSFSASQTSFVSPRRIVTPSAESAAWLEMCDVLKPTAPARTAAKASAPFGPPGLPRETLSGEVLVRLAAFEAQGAQLSERIREADVRNEWRRLARLVHPDRNPGLDGTRFASLQSSYVSLVQSLREISSPRRQAA